MNKQTESFLLAEADIAAAIPDQRGAVVGISRPHESAHLHVAGTATYTDDIPELAGTLHAALGMSTQAHARIVKLGLDRVKAAPGVVAVFTSADIPGTNDCGPIIHDDPILATDTVHFIGQPVFLVVATSHDAARRAARLGNIEYEVLPPLLTPEDARAAGRSVLPPMHLKRGEPAERIASAPHSEAGQMALGGQEQFYLEGQISYAVPKEDNG
ncbi:MAG: xanthine dehydrogenase molybdopterin binding subunit, partial [Ralstonia sp.]